MALTCNGRYRNGLDEGAVPVVVAATAAAAAGAGGFSSDPPALGKPNQSRKRPAVATPELMSIHT